MKILLATHQYFPEHIGGTEIYTHGIARRLPGKGIDVAVVTYREEPSPKKERYIITETNYEGVKIYQINYNLSLAEDIVLAEYNNEYTGKLFAEVLDSFRPDLVHFTHFMKISARAAEICRLSGVPYMVSLTDFWTICLRHTLLKWNSNTCYGPRNDTFCLKCFQHTHGAFKPLVARLPDHALRLGIVFSRKVFPLFSRETLSEANRLSLRNQYIKEQILNAELCLALSGFQKEMLVQNGYPADRIKLSQHGLETNGYLAKEEKREHAQIKMTYIGSIVKHKGVHLILEALHRSDNQNLVLEIYGNVSGEDIYLQKIRDMAARDNRVTLKGTVPFNQLGKVYSECDVLLMPSLWFENEPLVVKAAIFKGVPVIANNTGSLGEMIVHNKNGWLLQSGHLRSWIDVFDQLTRQKLNELDAEEGSVRTMDENFEEIYSYYKQIVK